MHHAVATLHGGLHLVGLADVTHLPLQQVGMGWAHDAQHRIPRVIQVKQAQPDAPLHQPARNPGGQEAAATGDQNLFHKGIPALWRLCSAGLPCAASSRLFWYTQATGSNSDTSTWQPTGRSA